MLKSINPFTNEVLAEFKLTNVADLDKKLDHAQSGFVNWRQTNFDERSQMLIRLSSTLKKNKDTYAELISREMGNDAEIYWKEMKAPDERAFFNPMTITYIKPGTPAYKDELFGPVASVFIVKDEKEALMIANDNDYGLGASIWSKDFDRARSLANKTEAGIVNINHEVHSMPELPFGGAKKSGIGREMAGEGIREFTNKKALWYETK